jgi:hypothetical protein
MLSVNEMCTKLCTTHFAPIRFVDHGTSEMLESPVCGQGIELARDIRLTM